MVSERAAISTSRTRVFTAIWPWSIGRRATEHHHDAVCQVTVQMIPSTSDDPAPATDGSPIITSKVVLFSEKLAIRDYNSLSLPDEGRYRLSLHDCGGRIPGSMTADYALQGEAGHGDEGENLDEIARLSFLSVPLALTFDVDDQVHNGGVVIGSFHLLPIAHLRAPPPPSTEGEKVFMGGEINNCGGIILACGQQYGNSPQHVKCECGEYGRPEALIVTAVATAGLLFTFVCICAWWAMTRRRSGHKTMGAHIVRGLTCLTRRDGDRAPRKSRGKVRKRENEQWSVDDGEMSDVSLDSDALLDGSVPDPVGLPRSEEDWRTLFDSLYQQKQEEAKAAAAAAAAALAHANNTSTFVPENSSGDGVSDKSIGPVIPG